MRNPDDSLSIAFCILPVADTVLARAFKAPTFVLIEVMTMLPFQCLFELDNGANFFLFRKILFFFIIGMYFASRTTLALEAKI
tara:strand:- start:116 stop:364 length:249 start_codon:yes stop_codon:yes gene_type:complete